ncbi:hypothetical protein BJ165DRAFT_1532212 [Panaeolus papilionaceus]|nr:hypothetical protein BJ165DRAFT_1532212 [Panaeolus papilionaceus]
MSGSDLKQHVWKRLAESMATRIDSDRDMDGGFPGTRPAWVGKVTQDDDRQEYTLDYLIHDAGVTLICMSLFRLLTSMLFVNVTAVHFSDNIPAYDSDNRNVGLFGCIPRSANWTQVLNDITNIVSASNNLLYVPEENHCREDFKSIAMGL